MLTDKADTAGLGTLPIDRQASAIWLQFHWMPRTQLDYRHHAELNIDTIQKCCRIFLQKRTMHPLADLAVLAATSIATHHFT